MKTKRSLVRPPVSGIFQKDIINWDSANCRPLVCSVITSCICLDSTLVVCFILESKARKVYIWFDFRLKLYWKLFVVMGVSWVFELASWAYPGKSCWTWIVTDVINLLQGLWFETCLLP